MPRVWPWQKGLSWTVVSGFEAGAYRRHLASLGEISKVRGVVALVGEGNHACGPATLARLDCGTATVSLADTVTITGQTRPWHRQSSRPEACWFLAGNVRDHQREPARSLDNVTYAVSLGKRKARTPFTADPDLEGCRCRTVVEHAFGAVYLKQWLEPTAGYLTLVESDAMQASCRLEFQIGGRSVNHFRADGVRRGGGRMLN